MENSTSPTDPLQRTETAVVNTLRLIAEMVTNIEGSEDMNPGSVAKSLSSYMSSLDEISEASVELNRFEVPKCIFDALDEQRNPTSVVHDLIKEFQEKTSTENKIELMLRHASERLLNGPEGKPKS